VAEDWVKNRRKLEKGSMKDSRQNAAELSGDRFILAAGLDRAYKGRVHKNIHFPLDDDVEFLAAAIFAEDQLILLESDLLAEVGDQLELCRCKLIEDVTLF
jgi:hypothetical protein